MALGRGAAAPRPATTKSLEMKDHHTLQHKDGQKDRDKKPHEDFCMYDRMDEQGKLSCPPESVSAIPCRDVGLTGSFLLSQKLLCHKKVLQQYT